MPDIEKLIESTKLTLAKILDDYLRLPPAEEIAWASEILNIKKGRFKEKMKNALDELKADLVRSIVEEEASAKSKYEVVFLKTRDELIPVKPEQVFEGTQFHGRVRKIIDLQEGDIPISYQTYLSICSGRANEMVQEIVVLRPVAEET